jgi:hypothetical protein
MKLIKIEAGHYETLDSYIIIKKEKSECTGHATEIIWVIIVDGKEAPRAYDTKKEAIEYAKKKYYQR